MEEPVKKFFRLAPGKEVRLKGAYIIKCEDFVKDENGEVVRAEVLRWTWTSRSGSEGANRKVKGTLHWVSAARGRSLRIPPLRADSLRTRNRRRTAQSAEAELDEDGKVAEAAPAADFMSRLNPNSLTVKQGFCRAVHRPFRGRLLRSSSCAWAISARTRIRPTRMPVFNRTVALKDGWAKEAKK